jgi:hypothetical protein
MEGTAFGWCNRDLQVAMNDKDVPQGLKPSTCWCGVARLKPCPSSREFFPVSMRLGEGGVETTDLFTRQVLSKNISTKGPRNCRSLGFARDDKGKDNGCIKSGCWVEAITLVGPLGRDHSGPTARRGPERTGAERSAVSTLGPGSPLQVMTK